MKNKTITYLFCILILINIAYAMSNKIIITDLHYEEGNLKLNGKIVKPGFFPDRRIQPKEGYRVDMISSQGEYLYGFYFEIPLNLYTDLVHKGTTMITGGVTVLNQTDFALTMPFPDDLKEIRFYDPEDTLVLTVNVKEENLSRQNNRLWIWIILILLLLLTLYYMVKRKKV